MVAQSRLRPFTPCARHKHAFATRQRLDKTPLSPLGKFLPPARRAPRTIVFGFLLVLPRVVSLAYEDKTDHSLLSRSFLRSASLYSTCPLALPRAKRARARDRLPEPPA